MMTTHVVDSQVRTEQVARLENELVDQRRTSGTTGMHTAQDQTLSHNERALWFIHRLAPESAAYNIAFAVTIRTALDHERFREAFAAMALRHEVLRRCYLTHEGRPVRARRRTAEPILTIHQAADWEWRRLNEFLAAEAHRPFDLENGPLLRAILLARGPGEDVLLLAAHHIAIDFWSVLVLMDDLGLAYTYGADQLQPLSRTYAQHVAEGLARIESPRGKAHAAFWRERLAGELPVLAMPLDRSRPAVQTYAGAARGFRLSDAKTKRLNELARARGTTRFELVLAVYFTLLRRYTGQTDLTVGAPAAGRKRPGDKAMVGYYVNPVVIRNNTPGNPPFSRFLKQLGADVRESLRHRDHPFQLLVEQLHPDRDPSRAPLFQTMFAYLKPHMLGGAGAFALGESGARLHLSGLEVESFPLEQRVVQFDLTLFAADDPEGLAFLLEYNTDLFEAATAERFAAHFRRLLAAVSQEPETPLNLLPMLDASERNALLAGWNQTAGELNPRTALHAFEARCARMGDAVALVFEDEQITYAALNQKATVLASHLRAKGLKRGDLAALYLRRGVAMVTSMLAAWKVGAAYVPLDPDSPRGRLAMVLAEAAPAVLMTTTGLADQLPEQAPAPALLDRFNLASQTPSPTQPQLTADDLAYVIFTSGSTGKPKGVRIGHGNVTNFLAAMDLILGGADETARRVWLAVTNLTFDIAFLELIWTLTRGLKTVVQKVADGALFGSVKALEHGSKSMGFSLFYFADDEDGDAGAARYKLLLDGARFADAHGFDAVWTPERHFHAFGGLYPNPSVTGAGLATITSRVGIRAGSVVLPLHNPVRVAEEWAVVDNLSGGRVGVSVASGWHADDFVFAPENFSENKAVMLDHLETIRRLWRGEAINFKGGTDQDVAVQIRPRPIQAELPVWFTAAGNPETFRQAGRLGANLLTHLLGQDLKELAEKIALYREAWRKAGHEGKGHVSLMLHTFVGEDMDLVRETVREPFRGYLRSSFGLMRNLAKSMGQDLEGGTFTEAATESLLDHAFERYFEAGALFGTPARCLEIVDGLKGIDVDEVACLIDFGVGYASAMAGLSLLNEVRQKANANLAPIRDYGLAASVREHGVTHMQCTPSMARLLLEDTRVRGALSQLETLLLGGEALPESLVSRLAGLTKAKLFNMYGPTETTIWSSVQPISDPHDVSLGRPILNTQVYVVDGSGVPVPPGAIGELWIGGAGVARDYLNRPELTAERFTPDPFAAGQGARLYHTGDLVRFRMDEAGALTRLSFVGRVDDQLKIRGHRVELGEIEAILAAHPGVRETAVLVRGQNGAASLCAYWTPRQDVETEAGELHAYLRETLPEHMRPALLVKRAEMPLTPAGKIDRKTLGRLADGAAVEASRQNEVVLPENNVERRIASIWRETLGLTRVGVNDNFFELGGHSLLLAQVHGLVNEQFELKLTMVEMFRYPTVRGLASHIQSLRGGKVTPVTEKPKPTPITPGEAKQDTASVAIIGMACRFPGAADVDGFWRNLVDGVESITFFSDEELREAGIPEELINDPNYVKASPVLEGADLFDADFFGYSPREAEIMDPQQRVFLECAWTALENGAQDPENFNGSVGVFAGCGMNTYLLHNLYPNRHKLHTAGDFQIMINNDKDFLATRVAYKLNLRGPVINVQTACSTSLVAVHTACESLLAGKCDMALAGGVSVRSPQVEGYLYSEGMIASPDGHCRAFDAESEGTLFGSGAGVVVLKRLERALADGDPIHAVIRGSAINNDGSNKVSFSAPSVEGQAEVIALGLRQAGVAAESIGYVEAHGTGTSLGDPIEMTALNTAFASSKRAVCAVGSVKTNMGHLDAASGVAGLIKAALTVREGVIPPSLHFKTPNSRIDFENGPFYVNAAAKPWSVAENEGVPRRAGVSSFGIGGANAHAVLEQPPLQVWDPDTRSCHLLVLSAKTRSALTTMTANLSRYLTEHKDINMRDVAYTLQVGRSAMPFRRVLVCSDATDALNVLQAGDRTRIRSAHVEGAPGVVFMFPGGGAQYPGMGRGLYAQEAVFRATVDECAEILKPHLDGDLRDWLYPEQDDRAASAALRRISIILPAVFTTSYALAKLWRSWGITPRAMIGHSLGEYAAACLAGVFSLKDALALVVYRGYLFEQTPRGAMLSVSLAEHELRGLLGDDLSLAAVNGPTDCVVSGPPEAVTALEQRLLARDVDHRRLHIDVAAHSKMLEPVLGRFAEFVAGLELQAPNVPYISNVTGDWITAEQATDPNYWSNHLRSTVRFSRGMKRILEEHHQVLLELGPGRTLSTLARRHPDRTEDQVVRASIRHPRDNVTDQAFLMEALGGVWLAGPCPDWRRLYDGERCRKLALPTYPFERRRFWVDAPGTISAWRQTEDEPMDQAADGECDAQEEKTAPRNETERKLAAIWRQLLGVTSLGVFDNFFELGGDSLLATRVKSRIREVFAQDIPLKTLFEQATLASLAESLGGHETLDMPTADGVTPIERVSRDGLLLLSHAQERLWFLDQLEGPSSIYNMRESLHIQGHFSAGALQRALDVLITRHETLRTVFPAVDGTAIQSIAPTSEVELQVVDLSGQRDEQLARAIARGVILKPFDLAEGPLVRFVLLKLAPSEHLLVVAKHHIISDGWSIGVLIQELTGVYQGIVSGAGFDLPPLAIQYADFAVWQRAWLADGIADEQLAYWKAQLADAPALLELPGDFHRSAIQRYAGAKHYFNLGAGLLKRLKQLAAQTDTTLFMVMQSAFAMLMYRYSGQTDVCLGSPIANRNRAELEPLIGFFVNTLVMRSDFSGRASFSRFLDQAKRVSLEAFAHQDVPFERVVAELQPERSLSHSPLFQVMFILQNVDMQLRDLPGLHLEPRPIDHVTAIFDLNIMLEEQRDGGMKGSMEYALDLFREATIIRMVDHYLNLLANLCENPELSVADVPLLGEEERTTILLGWNQTDTPASTMPTLHQWFAARASKHPDATAVVFGDESAAWAMDRHLSYSELNRAAEELAEKLYLLGVSPEDHVAIAVPRGLAMTVGVLGILMAGAAYVPLDPAYPNARIAAILKNARPAVVVTVAALLDALPLAGQVTLCLDEARGGQRETPVPALTLVGQADNPAYVIHTSGSTGTPKGIVLSHRALVNLLHWHLRTLRGGVGVLQFASLSFDASLHELFAAWLSGGSAFLTPESLRTDLDGLLQFVVKRRVRKVILPVVVLQRWAVSHGPEMFAGIKEIITTGEQLQITEPVARLFQGLEGRGLHNHYGPSETHVVTAFELVGDPADWPLYPSIGTPIDNTVCHILDSRMEPVPMGVYGELYLGGVCLARGYLDLPGLTAEKFVPSPHGGALGERLYRTGDLARYVPASDGGVAQIAFIGRLDFQVKIRGFRVEPAEIENVLSDHAGVEKALVLPYRGNTGMLLAAFFVADGAAADALPVSLRRHIAANLPDYMMPALVTRLETFPLTPNGKVDRKALTTLAESGMEQERGRRYTAPSTRTECRVAEIWSAVLGVTGIGAQDNFFELGGHSLMATKVVSRLGKSFGCQVPVKTLFAMPSLAALSAYLDAGQAEPTLYRGINPMPAGGEAVLSFAQQRLWFLERFEKLGSAYNMREALQLNGYLDVGALNRAVKALVTRHESLRTLFPEQAGAPLLVIGKGESVELTLVDFGALKPAEKETRLKASIRDLVLQPFDLANGPLIRFTLFRLTPREQVLVVVNHHIVSDGWSTGIIVRELIDDYTVLRMGGEIARPKPEISYKDFAWWQRQVLLPTVGEAQRAFWREHLDGAPGLLSLPTDFPREQSRSYRGAKLPLHLDGELTKALETLGGENDASLYMVLQAAFFALMAHYSGQSDVVVGTPIANRNHREVESLVGFLVNTLALRMNLADQPSFTALLRRTAHVALEAYANQDLPFDQVVEHLQPARSMSHTPIFQVLFILQNASAPMPTVESLEVKRLAVDHETALFDLTLSLEQTKLGLEGWAEYSADLFEAATIRRLLGHYENLLRSIIAQPDARITWRAMMADGERRTMLHALNETACDWRQFLVLPDLFEARIAGHGEASAAVFGGDGLDEHLSYAALNARANGLARHLQTLGAGPETHVAVCLNRSLDMLVAVLAVLKSGAAYVPLDPNYPAARQATMLTDARPVALIAEDDTCQEIPMEGVRRVRPNEGGLHAEKPAVVVDPKNPAYVIYTSGSTGRPKGIVLSHEALANLILWHLDHMAVGVGVFQFASLSFDASFHEIFAAWLGLGTIFVTPDDLRLDLDRLLHFIAARPIAKIILPVVVLQRWAEDYSYRPELFAGLDEIVTTGEQLQVSRPVSELFTALGGRPLHNHYGPSETHVVTAHTLDGAPSEWPVYPPIGKPISNCFCHVLSSDMEPVPPGVVGELFLGGLALARGYLGRPDLTAAAFVPNPYGATAGERLYRTGDLARYTDWGAGGIEAISFLGRRDNQVKIRGFRIEPGEVETVLGNHPAVARAVVLVLKGKNGPHLAAYVSAKAGARLERETLRTHLSERLPDYMVPAVIVLLDEFPLTPNGKVDRRVLAEMAPQDDESHVATAMGDTARVIASVWADVLGRSDITARDNFFELGGHSLAVSRVVSRLRGIFGLEIPLQTLFSEANLAGLADAVDQLTRNAVGITTPPIEKQDHGGVAPVSHAQRRLWFLDQFNESNAAYHLAAAVHLHGPLDAGAFYAALVCMVSRQAAMRTTFRVEGNEPVQVIHESCPPLIPVIDAQGLTAGQRAGLVETLIKAEMQHDFDLQRGPLVRFLVLRLEAERHLFIAAQHHIISDGWSIGVLIDELSTHYNRLLCGETPDVTPPAISYADYAIWQNRWMTAAASEVQLDFWRRHLADAPKVLSLPTDWPRPKHQRYRGSREIFTVDAALTKELIGLGARYGATLFMVLRTAWAVLLMRQSGQEDFCIGSPVANRNRRELEPLVGFFVNTLAMRHDLSGNPTFVEALIQTRRTAIDCFAHQEVPFEWVVEAVQPERDLSRTPLVQVSFILQNTPGGKLNLRGLQAEMRPLDSGAAKFDMTLAITENQSGLAGELEYNCDLFRVDSIKRMLEQFIILLGGITQEPDQRVWRLPLMNDEATRQLLARWNDTKRDFPPVASIHQLFEASASAAPDRIAVGGEENVSYGMLARRADFIAHRLGQLGVGPGDVVGVYGQKCAGMIAAFLGTLRSGAAYVPLDPNYPAERLAFMTREAGVSILLTDENAARAEITRQFTIINWNDCPADEESIQLGDGPAPLDTAYVIFTSGSTGRPKGAMISHRSAVNFLFAFADNLEIEADDVMLAVTTISFDVHVLDLYPPLMRGARLAPVDQETAMDGRALASLLPRYGITVLHGTPATWRLLMTWGERPARGLKVLCGGEALPCELARDLIADGALLWNLYGPTEATVVSVYERVQAEDVVTGQGSVPIGRPPANVALYVLDPYLQPTPLGVPGELYISGTALARGYLKRPDLTAERFIPNPFKRNQGEGGVPACTRLYRSGDRVRYLPDGRLVYLERIDHQVKLRGFRIELGEIEATLIRHAKVSQAAVLIHGRENARLVAYLATGEAGTGNLTVAALRGHLRQTLPEYMIPANFVLLDRLPLTPNGKVDRRALPPWEAGDLGTGERVAPRTELEGQIAAMWCEVLECSEVGVHENFFDLGGHSLLAASLMTRLAAALGVTISLRELFEHPTVETLALRIEGLQDQLARFEAPGEAIGEDEDEFDL